GMAARNTALGLGAPIALPGVPAALERRVHAVEIDGALHAHEWLVCGDGTLLKADALDHCAAHDLIGCQDIAWDVAGAIAELTLDTVESAELSSLCDPDLLAFYRGAYLAFRIGAYRLSAEMLGHDPAEAERNGR